MLSGVFSSVFSGVFSGGVADYGGCDLAYAALLDELFRADRFGAEFLLGPGYYAYHRKGSAAGIKEVIVAGRDRQPKLSTDVDNPLLDRCLAVRVTRLTHLLTHGEMETIDGVINEAIAVELIFASHEHIAE